MPICSECGREFERPFGGGDLGRLSLASTCPDCTRAQIGSEAAEAEAAKLEVALELPKLRPLVTAILIGFCVLVYIAMVALGVSWWEPSGEQALRWSGNFGPATFGHQWWRLFTSTFVHFGLLHLALNMWVLWDLGGLAERLMGHARFLLVYVAAGLGAGITSLVWHPMIISAGASGAIFGVAGALVSFLYLKKKAVRLPALKKRASSVLAFISYNLFYGATKAEIDNGAHLGGLVMGLAIGAMLACEKSAKGGVSDETSLPKPATVAELSSGNRPRPRLALIAAGSAFLILAGAALAVHVQSSVVQLSRAQSLLEKGQIDRGIAELKMIVARKPDFAAAQCLLGSAYLQKDRYKEAIDPLKKAVELNPQNVFYEHELAVAYLGDEDYEDAMNWFKNVLLGEPNDPRAHFGLGTAYLGASLPDRAIEELGQAVALQPDFFQAQSLLGRAYLLTGRYDEAIATFDKVLGQHPDYDEAARDLTTARLLKSGLKIKVIPLPQSRPVPSPKP